MTDPGETPTMPAGWVPTPAPIGVLVMAYGTPATPDDVEPYYTHIRRGRPPTPEQLANLKMRYDALGGISTLAARTADQIEVLRAALEASHPGRYLVTLGQKHAAPFIEDGVVALQEAGANAIVGVVLAPHYSQASVGEYQARAGALAQHRTVPFSAIGQWHDLPEYRTFLADAITDALPALPERTEVIFTAHSLPERVMANDVYPDQLAESATAVAEALGLERWSIAWQSAGATPEPWRGPDILEVIREKAADPEVDGILVCAQGFVADHLEVAYDLDIEAQKVADEAGIAFARTRALNDDPVVLAALAASVSHLADFFAIPPD